ATPAFRGGAAGWFSYELGRELEVLPERAAPDADVPDLHLGLYDFALAEECATGRRWIVGRGEPAQARRLLDELAVLPRPARPPPARRPSRAAVSRAPPTRPRCGLRASTSSTATSTR